MTEEEKQSMENVEQPQNAENPKDENTEQQMNDTSSDDVQQKVTDADAEWREKIKQAKLAEEEARKRGQEEGEEQTEEQEDTSSTDMNESSDQTNESETQSEEIKDEKSHTESQTPDPETAMSPIGIIFGNPDKIAEEVNHKYSAKTQDEMSSLIEDRDPDMMRYLILRNLIQTQSDETDFLRESLESIKKDVGELKESLVNTTDDRASSGTKHHGEIGGASAKLSTIAAIRGLKKVYLYNSGFHIVIRPFTLSELNAYYNSVDNDSDELGRELGGLFHVITDLYIKQKFMELVPLATVSSNLVNWNEGDTLVNNISIHDYETLLWAMCTLMYKNEGVTIPLTCVAEECHYRVDDFTIDLNKIRFNRKGVLSKEQMEFVMDGEAKTEEQLEEFRNNTDAFNKSVQYGDMQYHLQVPTLGEFISTGNKLIASITAYAQEATSLRDNKVLNELLLHANKMFVSWIKRFTYGNPDENGFSTTDNDAIMESLDLDIHQDTNFWEDITSFVRDSKVSYYCYTNLECPVCGVKPTQGTIDEFTVMDIQYLFFDLTCRKLGLKE